jgi:hypothetical protein
VELEDGVSLSRAGVWVILVAVVFGFLGWFLIGRHAGDEDRVDADQPAVESTTPTPSPEPVPGAQPESDQAAVPAVPDEDVKTDPPAVTAVLNVLSDPPGAAVFINDEARGVTPTKVRGLVPGSEVQVRVELAGYKPWAQVIGLDDMDLEREIKAGLIKTNSCKLGTGFLYLKTTPAGATVELDGKRLPGKTPKVINDVCAKVPLRLRIEAAGRRPWRGQVTIEPNDIHNLEIQLEK